MSTYRIRALGEDFEAEDEGCEYANADEATAAAIKAAIFLAADEAARLQRNAVVEARLEDGENIISRHVIALSVEPLPLP